MNVTLFTRQLGAYFDTHLPEVRNYSVNTIESYADAFKLLFQYFDEKKALPHYKIDYKNFTPVAIEDFTLWLTRERGYKSASVRQRLSAINSFLKYASRREMSAVSAFTAISGAEKPTLVKSPFPYFTLEEMGILLRLPNIEKQTEKRNLVLLSLFYDSAARAQELCDLKVGDIKFGATTKIKLLGKGNKTREIPISGDVAKLLHYHLHENELDGKHSDPLFISQLGDQMTTACIRNIVNKYVAMARSIYPNLFHEVRYSPHSFRHSKAVHMIESGTQLIYIRNFLGHESVISTEIYARIGQEKLTTMLKERGKSSEHTTFVEKTHNSKYPDFLNTKQRK